MTVPHGAKLPMAATMTTENHDYEITCTGFANDSRNESFIVNGYFGSKGTKVLTWGDYPEQL